MVLLMWVLMMAPGIRPVLLTAILIIAGTICFHSTMASDDLRQSSHVGALRMPLVSYERIPIETVLAHPERFHMRELRLVGTVTTIQTEIILNRQTCGKAHERTTLTVEDDTGSIEVIDQGACGRNLSPLKAPMLKIGQQIDLLVLLIISVSSGTAGSSLEVMISFLDLARN